jgi:acetate kinase
MLIYSMLGADAQPARKRPGQAACYARSASVLDPFGMHTLVINCGSSSLKYRLFDMADATVLAAGLVERIGEGVASLHHRARGRDGRQTSLERDMAIADHRAALAVVEDLLATASVIDLACLGAIGHRVVHGGEAFQAPVQIDADVLAAIRRLVPLAPLHNPANLLGIEICLERFPRVPQVAVFDTAFHQGMPAHAYRYALPSALYTERHVRRYGFHGTSHAYVARQAAALLGRPLAELRLVSLHLGNGASAAAIAGGRSIDTSMGMTPLEGLVMGTRSGDIDPALVFYIARATGLGYDAIEDLLNRASGLRGLCGSNDMREVLRRRDAGDPEARLALEIYCYRIKKYLGAYWAALGGLDAVIFTAGIGEHAPAVRADICAGLEGLGLHLDAARNEAARGVLMEVSAPTSPVRILVVPTDEELEIARQTAALVAA